MLILPPGILDVPNDADWHKDIELGLEQLDNTFVVRHTRLYITTPKALYQRHPRACRDRQRINNFSFDGSPRHLNRRVSSSPLEPHAPTALSISKMKNVYREVSLW